MNDKLVILCETSLVEDSDANNTTEPVLPISCLLGASSMKFLLKHNIRQALDKDRASFLRKS